MSTYSHLTIEQRYQISALIKSEKLTISEIARQLNCHRSTIYRELNRNIGKKGYRPKQANTLAIARKSRNQTKLTDFFWAYVRHLLAAYYSPEQINGRLKHLGFEGVGSIESIYQYIYKDKRQKGALHLLLRCQKKYRKRHYKARDRRGQITNRADISLRPEIIEQRERFGDWEGDTIVGRGHRGVLLTLVERKTRFTKMMSLPNRKASLICKASTALLRDFDIKSITFDNGKEFALHEQLGKNLGADIYFARPYHSWERGTNENTNGLIRQFFSKRMPLDKLDCKLVQKVENLLNHRPRKVLGYLTPFEAMGKNRIVALRI